LADRGEEQRLQHPRLRRIRQVRARDEDGVVARRPGRQLGRAREEARRPVLHRPQQTPVVVVIHTPPRATLLLAAAYQTPLVRRAPGARLPPHALVAHLRRRLERPARQSRDPSAHVLGPIWSTTISTAAGSTSAMRRRYSRTRCCTPRATSGIDAPQSTARCSSMRT